MHEKPIFKYSDYFQNSLKSAVFNNENKYLKVIISMSGGEEGVPPPILFSRRKTLSTNISLKKYKKHNFTRNF